MLTKQQSLKRFSWKMNKLWLTVKRLEKALVHCDVFRIQSFYKKKLLQIIMELLGKPSLHQDGLVFDS